MFDLWISRDDRVKVGQSPRAMDPNVETNTRVLCGSSSCKPSSMVYPIGFLRCVAEMKKGQLKIRSYYEKCSKTCLLLQKRLGWEPSYEKQSKEWLEWDHHRNIPHDQISFRHSLFLSRNRVIKTREGSERQPKKDLIILNLIKTIQTWYCQYQYP